MINNETALKKHDLNFSSHFNNKLLADTFTTLRINEKYNIGEIVNVVLRKELLCHAEIVGKKCFKLNDINDFISFIDMGVTAAKGKQIIQDWYKNIIDWTNQDIYFYLLRKQNDKYV